MKLIFSCSSEDTEFIDLIKKEFSSSGTISEYKVSGITGYETVMLILQVAAVTATTIVPFIIEDNLKMFYYRGLKEWDNEKGYLTDTCLTAQDRYKAYLDYFRIPYEVR